MQIVSARPGQAAIHAGCLRRATESRKTFLLSLELAGMGKGLDVTTTGRTGKMTVVRLSTL
jgi:hypothetical protein